MKTKIVFDEPMLERTREWNKHIIAFPISTFDFPIWENHLTIQFSVTPSIEG